MQRFLLRFVFASALSAFSAVAMAQSGLTLSLHNPAAVKAGLTEVPLAALQAQAASLLNGPFKVVNAANGKEIVYQVCREREEQGRPATLLLDVPLEAGAKARVRIVPGKPSDFKARAFGRYVPERKDDFAWENNRVAFRMYGRALEATPKEMAYGVDVWSKRTSELVINKWYKRTNYHKDDGEGLDYYHVGLTLGAGGIAPYAKDSIWYPRNYSGHRMLDSGALRVTFELSYDAWNVDGQSVTMVKVVSLDADAQLSRMQVRFSVPVPVAVGIIKRPEPGAMLLDEKAGILGYWEPQHGKDGTTGVGVILTGAAKEMKVLKGQLLALTAPDQRNEVVYYTGAAYDKAGLITNDAQWFRYLGEQAERLRHPVTSEIIKQK
ncbi:DUF4861 family protein [Chitinophaga lutea]